MHIVHVHIYKTWWTTWLTVHSHLYYIRCGLLPQHACTCIFVVMCLPYAYGTMSQPRPFPNLVCIFCMLSTMQLRLQYPCTVSWAQPGHPSLCQPLPWQTLCSLHISPLSPAAVAPWCWPALTVGRETRLYWYTHVHASCRHCSTSLVGIEATWVTQQTQATDHQ